MERTFDPIRDAEAYYNECDKLPRCDKCGVPIEKDRFVFWRNTERIDLCEKCFKEITEEEV